MTSKRSIGWFLEILGDEVFSLISSVRLKNQPKSHASLYPFDKPIKPLYFRPFVFPVLFARFLFKVIRKSLQPFFFSNVSSKKKQYKTPFTRVRANVWTDEFFNLCNRFTRKRANSVTELLTQVRTNIFKCQHWIFSLFTKARNWVQDCIVQTVQKTYLVQLLTRVRVKVPPYRWTLTYFLLGQKLAEFVVQIFARLRGSRKNERRTRASFCPFKKVS